MTVATPGPKRILLATTVPITIEAFLLPLVRRLTEDGWDVDGMAHGLSDSPSSGMFHRAWDVSWSRSPIRSLVRAPATIRAIRSIVTARRYDLIHVQTPIAGFLTRLAVGTLPSQARPRLIYTAHGFHFHPQGGAITNRIALTLERLAARWTDAIVVTNASDLASARVHRLLPEDRIVGMPGVGVDVNHFRAERVSSGSIDAVHRALKLRPRTPLIVCVAELNRNKNQSFLIRALARMRAADAHVVLRGEGREEAGLLKLARDLGVGDRVHLVGFQADARPLLRAARVCVLVSRREGLPRVIMEALSLEVPVVGTDIRGIRDLLEDGVGTLVQPGDVGALAAALDAVITDPATAAARARLGRERMVTSYGLDLVLDMHMELYARTAGGRA
jgi:glycosyltransferase involved in cell wall biosynthesis